MHKIVLPLIGLAVFGLTLLLLLLFGPGGVSAGADPFLQALTRRDFVGASALRTQRFRDAVPQAEFERYLADSGLATYAGGSWHNWRVESGVGSIDGEATNSSGARIPLRIVLRKENGQWRVDGLQRLRAGVDSDSPAAVLPSADESVALVRGTTTLFAAGINARDFTRLRDAASPELKAQYSVADLDAQFKGFTDLGLDLSPLGPLTPNFRSEPAVDSNGELQLIGYYPVEDAKVEFNYRYAHRFTGWRLISIQFNYGPPD